ncbi:MAG: hypothetical protein KDB24_09785 [Microthrixaceae bacterium]|nr:hypothetical protein [Microthrixaceae bacterium]
MSAWLHPDYAHLAADEGRAGALAIGGAALEAGATWSAEHAATRADELRAELNNLTGWHPIRRGRIRAELAALDLVADVADDLDLYDLDDEHDADGPAPWEPGTGWEVGP